VLALVPVLVGVAIRVSTGEAEPARVRRSSTA
jgi:hypothetical protein